MYEKKLKREGKFSAWKRQCKVFDELIKTKKGRQIIDDNERFVLTFG